MLEIVCHRILSTSASLLSLPLPLTRMGNTNSSASLSQLTQNAGEISKTSAGNLDQTALSASEYEKVVEAVLADATPEFRALLDRVGTRDFIFQRHSPDIHSSISATADASGRFDEKLAAFTTRLGSINSRLDSLAKDAISAFEVLSRQASLDFKLAIEKLVPLVAFIQGDWRYSAEDASKAEALVTDLSKRLERATKSANVTLETMNWYEAAFAQIRDADLLGMEQGLEVDLEKFKNDIGSQIGQTNGQLTVLNQTLAFTAETLKNRQQDLNAATERYKKAVSDAESAKAGEIAAWILAWPVGLVLHYTVSQNFTDDVSNAQKMVDQAITHQTQVQNDIISVQAQFLGLRGTSLRFEQFQVDTAALEAGVHQAIGAAEAHRRASADVEKQVLTTWGNVKATAIAAAAAGWALNKVQYANVILTTLDDARFEKSVKADAIAMLNALKDQDDPNQSVAKISHPVLFGKSYLQVLLEQYSQIA